MKTVGQTVVIDKATVTAAIYSACIAELGVLKPGNVSVHSDGHGMVVEDFVHSARVIAPLLAEPGISVGERILTSIQATNIAVGCNTNLGIVLLCAPLAHAALNLRPGQPLREALGETLLALDTNDTRLTFEAIRLAKPAGLGEVAQHDVGECTPHVSLLQVMRTARGHDRIAQQYASNYADIFEIAVPRLYDGMSRWDNEESAVMSTYLGLLSEFPDTHIERKHGARQAQDVRARAQSLNDILLNGNSTPQLLTVPLMRFDSELKQQGINPGTSADLTVVALAVKRLQDCLQILGKCPFMEGGTVLDVVSQPFL